MHAMSSLWLTVTCVFAFQGPNVLQSIQIHLLSSLHNIFHITTDVHIQSLGDFLFLLIDISAPGRLGQNWSSILTRFQRIHWQIQAVYCKKMQFHLYILLTWTLPLHDRLKLYFTKSILNTQGSGGGWLVFLRDVNIWNSFRIPLAHTFDCDF